MSLQWKLLRDKDTMCFSVYSHAFRYPILLITGPRDSYLL